MSIYSIKSYINHRYRFLYMDHRTEIFALLSQLTNAPEIDLDHFKNIILGLKDNHDIYIYIKENKIVGMITLLFEQKLIHNGAYVAHIEDLVVDRDYLKQGIGAALINHCLQKINNNKYKCYKIILDCKRELIGFYEKFGFENKNVQMSKYL